MENQLNHAPQNDIEVQIADVGERIAAYFINAVAQFTVCIPLLWSFLASLFDADWESLGDNEEALARYLFENINHTLLIISICIILAYGTWQIIMMSTRGQSLGKQIMNLAVIKQNGEKAGFLGVVVLREVVFGILVTIVGILLGILFNLKQLGDVFTNIILLVCLVMMFKVKDRRTLQDMLANTVVVKLPPKRSPKSQPQKIETESTES